MVKQDVYTAEHCQPRRSDAGCLHEKLGFLTRGLTKSDGDRKQMT